MNDVHQGWDRYQRVVVPADAPMIQLLECRRAYFAGAQAVAEILRRIEDDDGTAEQRKTALDDCIAEIKAFQARVAAGRA